MGFLVYEWLGIWVPVALTALSVPWYPFKRRAHFPEQGLVAVQSCIWPGGNKKAWGHTTMTSLRTHGLLHHRLCWNSRIMLISPLERVSLCRGHSGIELRLVRLTGKTGARSRGRGLRSWFLGSRWSWGVWKAMMNYVWPLVLTTLESLLTTEL